MTGRRLAFENLSASFAAAVSDCETTSNASPRVWRRRFFCLAAAWLAVTIATSFGTVRGWLIGPLHVHDGGAAGEFAYVMADGPATWERLRAASDLYHFHRIEKIYLLNEQRSSGWNFVRKASDSRVQREIDYLGLFGVPVDRIVTVPLVSNSWMSSLAEAQSVAAIAPNAETVIVVTSPPHTRRSRLCFRRVFPEKTKIFSYSPGDPDNSAETHFPIWIEYAKLFVYWCCA